MVFGFGVIAKAAGHSEGVRLPEHRTEQRSEQRPAHKTAHRVHLAATHNDNASARRALANVPQAVKFDFKVDAFSNLVYHIDCLAGLVHCSSGPLRALWQSDLGLSHDDEKQLELWAKTSERYLKSFQFELESPPAAAYPRDGQETGVDLAAKLRLAAFQSSSLTEYHDRVQLVARPGDADVLTDIVRKFEPRFQKWWDSPSGPSKWANGYALRMEESLHNQQVTSLLSKVAHFYSAKGSQSSSDPIRIRINLIARPKSTITHTTGEQLENHAIVETLEGEDAAKRAAVVLHEVFHFLYKLAPESIHKALMHAFVDAKEDISLRAYNLLDESLATAFGNGMLNRTLQTKEQFSAFIEKPRSFYDDEYIDKLAKALLPLLDNELENGSKISPRFVDSYLTLARSTLGDIATSPLLSLRVMSLVYGDQKQKPLVHQFSKMVRARATFQSFPIDSSLSRRKLASFKELSGALFVYRKAISSLASWRDIMGKLHVEKIQDLAKETKSFVYMVPRSSKAAVYVFVAEDNTTLEQLLFRFVSTRAAFSGVLEGD